MKKRFKIKKFLLFILLLIVVVVGILIGMYYYLINYSAKSEKVTFVVNEGDTYNSIAKKLKEKELIKSEIAYKIYIKLNKPKKLELGEYSLNKSYRVEELVEKFEKGSNVSQKTITLTFVEGKNMRHFIELITKNFNIKEEEILSKLKDKKYLDTLINSYWFLKDDIKNDKLYYSLEGYLFPDTYEFYLNSTIDDIFRTMLNNTESKLKDFKEDFKNSKYSIHQIFTLASIIELEAGTAIERKGVAGVFYNRLNGGWSLGSDVTTYYAQRIDNWSVDLKQSQLDTCDNYNTRASCMIGKFPVGPICNPSFASIIASLDPQKHKYYYFVADKNGKTYFSKTDAEHNSTCEKLKRDNLWIEYTE